MHVNLIPAILVGVTVQALTGIIKLMMKEVYHRRHSDKLDSIDQTLKEIKNDLAPKG